MTEIEFHIRRFEMLSNTIIGLEDMQGLIDLYWKKDPSGYGKISNQLLDRRNQITKDIAFYNVLFTESLIYLEDNSINPTFLSTTLQQCIDLDLTSLGRYSIIPVKIYVSVINFFKSIFKSGN